MPLSDREGWGRDEAEPEELPDYQSPYGSIRSIVPASDGEGDFERICIDAYAHKTFRLIGRRLFLLQLREMSLLLSSY